MKQLIWQLAENYQ